MSDKKTSEKGKQSELITFGNNKHDFKIFRVEVSKAFAGLIIFIQSPTL